MAHTDGQLCEPVKVNVTVKTTPWQPSGAPASIVTTFATVPGALAAPAATAKLRPVAFATVTLDEGQLVGSPDVTVPAVIEVNVTGYGFGLAIVKNRSPWVKPGNRSAAPDDVVTVKVCAVKAFAPPLPDPPLDHNANAPPAPATANTPAAMKAFNFVILIDSPLFSGAESISARSSIGSAQPNSSTDREILKIA